MGEHGTFTWNELMTTEPEKAGRFYGGLLGWTTRQMDMGAGGVYTIFSNQGKDCGGMMKMAGPQFAGVPPHWMSYIAVDDVDATVAKVKGLSGAVHMPAFDIPGIGRMAVIADPAGAVFCLITFVAKAA